MGGHVHHVDAGIAHEVAEVVICLACLAEALLRIGRRIVEVLAVHIAKSYQAIVLVTRKMVG